MAGILADSEQITFCTKKKVKGIGFLALLNNRKSAGQDQVMKCKIADLFFPQSGGNPFEWEKHRHSRLIVGIILAEFTNQFFLFQHGAEDEVGGENDIDDERNRINIPGPENKQSREIPGVPCHVQDARGVQAA